MRLMSIVSQGTRRSGKFGLSGTNSMLAKLAHVRTAGIDLQWITGECPRHLVATVT
jgi:hypothetical protein